MSRPPVDCCVQRRGCFRNTERRLFNAHWGAQCVAPVSSNDAGLTLFAVDVDIGHAGARSHLVVG